MILPQPLPPVAQRSKAWPVDPEAVKERKVKEAAAKSLRDQSNLQKTRDGSWVPFDQLRVDRSTPSQSAAQKRCQTQSNVRGCDWVPFRNILENVGLAKPDEIIAGQEPDRDWLTDPPKGYRLPTANTVATPDNSKPAPDPHNSKALLYQPPEN